MIIRADTNDKDKVPDIGDIFVVTKVEKVAAFWIIELKKEMNDMKKTNEDSLSHNYKCGHPTDPVIINTTEDSLAVYNEWKSDKSGLCLKCWMEQRKMGE